MEKTNISICGRKWVFLYSTVVLTSLWFNILLEQFECLVTTQ